MYKGSERNGLHKERNFFTRFRPERPTLVNTTTSKDFKLVVDVLKRHNNSFYTHQLPEEKTTIVGLPEQDTEYIETVLAEVNIAPCVIKKLELKKKLYADQCMYFLHFPRGSITLSELKQVRAVDHHRVYFEYYSNKYGPMQCTTCQRYGHGSANCYLPPVCVKCADKYISKTCPLSQTTTCPDGKIAPAKLKCTNCSEHHAAPAWLRLKKVTLTPSRSREFTYNETSFLLKCEGNAKWTTEWTDSPKEKIRLFACTLNAGIKFIHS